MDKTSNDPVRGNGHARAVQRLPARRVRDFSWPCSRVNLRGGAQKAAVARNRATFTWPCAATPCTRQVVQRALAGAPRPGRETTFMGRRHYHQRCIGRAKAARGVLWSARHACERGVGKRRCSRFGRLSTMSTFSRNYPPEIGAGGSVWLVSSLLSLRWPILQRQKHTTTTVRTHKVVPFRSVHVMGTPTVPSQYNTKTFIHHTRHESAFYAHAPSTHMGNGGRGRTNTTEVIFYQT